MLLSSVDLLLFSLFPHDWDWDYCFCLLQWIQLWCEYMMLLQCNIMESIKLWWFILCGPRPSLLDAMKLNEDARICFGDWSLPRSVMYPGVAVFYDGHSDSKGCSFHWKVEPSFALRIYECSIEFLQKRIVHFDLQVAPWVLVDLMVSHIDYKTVIAITILRGQIPSQ